MLARYLYNTRSVTLLLVHLTSLVGVLSLWNVAQPLYFFLFLFTYLIGVYLDFKGLYPVRRLFLNFLSVTLTLYFLSFLTFEDLLRPFSHVVLLLLAIKSLEEKKPRDLYQLLLLSLFAISISTAYNLSLSFLLVFVLHSFLGVVSLVFLNLYRKVGNAGLSWEDYRRYALTGFGLFLLVALFTLPFFFFLPRTQTPLFDLLSRGGGLKTGLAESVVLGKVGEIQEDNTVVLRVYGLPPTLKEPYWRAVVFDTYSQGTWLKVREEKFSLPEGAGNITYTLVVSPTFEKILPALDYPYSVLRVEGMKAQAYMVTGNALRLEKNIDRALRVLVSSSSELVLVESPERYLQVPQGVSSSMLKLASQLSQGTRTDREKVERVVSHFSKGYQYSLKLERYEGDPLDYFLFVSRKGNCEYYASATALLLRLMGVPARLVGGYRGALWNAYGGYHIVTNSMAHVWVEAYVEGRWIRVDTTPPYVAPALQKISAFALIRDALVSFWHSYIVGYSSEKQIRLFRVVGQSIRTELKAENLQRRFLQVFLWLLAGMSLYLLVYVFLRLRKTPENLYLRTLNLLRREGVLQKETLPEEILSACKGREYYSLVKFILSIYQRHRYSPYRVYPDEVREGYRTLERLKESIRSARRS